MRSDTSSVGPGIDGAFGAGSSGGFVVADLKAASAESREPIGGRYRPGVLAIANPFLAIEPARRRGPGFSLASGRVRINAAPGRRNAGAPSAFPLSLPREADVALTGRFNFRKTLTGKVVLQLEEDVKAWWPSRKRTKRRWRDANLMDLARPELRPLIDLRQRPNYQAQSYKLEELDLDEATLPMQGGRPAPHNGSGRISAH